MWRNKFNIHGTSDGVFFLYLVPSEQIINSHLKNRDLENNFIMIIVVKWLNEFPLQYYTCMHVLSRMSPKLQTKLVAIISEYIFSVLKGHTFQDVFLVTAGGYIFYTSSEKDKVILGKYRLVILTSVPEKIPLRHISEHVKEKVTRKS